LQQETLSMSLPFPQFTPDHIHPMLINFTSALVPTSVASDIAGRVLSKPSLNSAAWWMLVWATAITPLTGFSGWWWKQKSGNTLPHDLITEHLWLGVGIAVAFIVMLLWRRSSHRKNQAPGLLYFAFGASVIVALMVQGALGGAMVFGG
jgi:uncharacterized membrane protein